MSFLLTTKQLTKEFPRSTETIRVLDECDFTLEEGEAIAVTGPSGSGKSTFLNIVGGLDLPTSGSVLYKDEPLQFSSHSAMEYWRSVVVGFIFQFHFLLPDFTALENLLIPVRAAGGDVIKETPRARDFLEIMGLADRATHLPGELSGGEQQRVAIARAFMNHPKIVLADEPFGNLDLAISQRLSELLFQLRDREGTSLVIVTHDPDLAARSDRALFLKDGKLVPSTEAD